VTICAAALERAVGYYCTAVVAQEKFVVASRVDQVFTMCGHEEMKQAADILQDIPLTLEDRFTFCQAPIQWKKDAICSAVREVLIAVQLAW
jgi:hypothetical protein